MSELLLRRRNLILRKQEELNIRAVCFEADGEQTVSITMVGTAPTITLQYSYDGVTWNAWDLSALPFGGSTKVYVRGMGNSTFGKDNSNYNKITFGTDAYVYVSGIIESLLDGKNEKLILNTSGILRNLFYRQTALRSAENLRFEAISTGNNGDAVYAYMFYGCTNLLYAPKVLSITTFRGGYECIYMFKNCENLVKAPELPSTNLYGFVYQNMFDSCISLVNAPELPATTLTKSCYYGMFRNCSSLVNAPELPATTLVSQCYQNMFYGCTSLKTIRCRAKVTASSATVYWLYGASPSGTFYGYSEYSWAAGASGIPSGWEFVELTD